MSNDTMPLGGRAPSISWVVLVGAGLVVASALILLSAPVGYRLGIVPLRTALLTLFRWGAYAAVAAVGVSLLGLVVTLLRPRDARRGIALSVVAVLVGAVLVAAPARFRFGPPAPPIHDITTDTQHPPPFVAVVPLNTPDRTVYEGEAITSQQREAYPDLKPVTLEMPPAQAFERALVTVQEMGWELVATDADAGRIEGDRHDLLVRVQG